jgi:F0F1-type ATP synthase assembly protein I
MDKEPETRSAALIGIEWASKVSTIALSFSLPAIIGFGIDRWWGSGPVGTLIGVVLGFVAGLLQILQLSREISGTHAGPTASGNKATKSGADRVERGTKRPGHPKDDH